MFKIRTGCKLGFLSKETIILLGRTKHVTAKDNNVENVPKLEMVDIVLTHCNLVSNNYQQASKVLFTFVTYKQFGQSLFPY